MPTIPKQVRWVSSVIGFVFFVLGIADAPEEVKTWGRWLAGLPTIRVPWWVLIVVGLTLLGWAWGPSIFQRRRQGQVQPAPKPKVSPPAPEPLPLSVLDRESIEQARILWRKTGGDAIARAATLLFQIQTKLPAKNRFAVLIEFPRDQLERTRAAVADALHDRSTQSLEKVTVCLRLLFDRYLHAAAWIQYTAASEEMPDPWATQFQEWQAAHRRFRDAFAELSLRSDYSALWHIARENDSFDES